jgi:hypothetical protein
MPGYKAQCDVTERLLPIYFQKHPGLKEKIEALHAKHKATCEEIGVEPNSFKTFALDIVNAPERAQKEMLDSLPPEQYEANWKYGVYIAPRVDW